MNVRDLGGLPTEDGGQTSYGRVVRADNLTGLTAAGWDALTAHGVRRVVDLRWPEERAEGRPHAARAAEVLHVSVFGEAREDMLDGSEPSRRPEDVAERKSAAYLARLDRYADRFARAVGLVAGAPNGAVAVHCAGGVDRTGLVCALILRAAGVPSVIVAEDYAVSEASWAPHVSSWIDAVDDEAERERRRFLATIPAAAMLRVLATLERRSGGTTGYLLRAGLTEADLERVRVRLRA